MLKPDQVPKEAIEAAAVMLSNGKTTAQAIAAALNAWPGMWGQEETDAAGTRRRLILPLSEKQNAEG